MERRPSHENSIPPIPDNHPLLNSLLRKGLPSIVAGAAVGVAMLSIGTSMGFPENIVYFASGLSTGVTIGSLMARV